MSFSLEEAKTMLNDDSLSKLKNMVTPKPVVDMGHKVNNDIIMSALCRAVSDDIIKMNSLNEKIIKLLNSSTNTLSAIKVGAILSHVRKNQPKICCVITLKSGDMNTTINEWIFTGPEVKFSKMFGFVVDHFEITPTMVRNKMTEMLKTTIVNNVAQLVAKFKSLETDEEKDALTISISTVTRLVNMSDAILIAEFKEVNV